VTRRRELSRRKQNLVGMAGCLPLKQRTPAPLATPTFTAEVRHDRRVYFFPDRSTFFLFIFLITNSATMGLRGRADFFSFWRVGGGEVYQKDNRL
jgi:hypothetical protein